MQVDVGAYLVTNLVVVHGLKQGTEGSNYVGLVSCLQLEEWSLAPSVGQRTVLRHLQLRL